MNYVHVPKWLTPDNRFTQNIERNGKWNLCKLLQTGRLKGHKFQGYLTSWRVSTSRVKNLLSLSSVTIRKQFSGSVEGTGHISLMLGGWGRWEVKQEVKREVRGQTWGRLRTTHERSRTLDTTQHNTSYYGKHKVTHVQCQIYPRSQYQKYKW